MSNGDHSRFRELIVWQKAMDLVDEVYLIQKNFPKSETFALGDQIRRAVVSIPSNIAEGHGRGSRKDYIHFLQIARGSTYEVMTQLEIAVRQKLVSNVDRPMSVASEIARMLNSMIARLSP